MVVGSFFVDVFNISGRLAKPVRDTGIQSLESDLTPHGGGGHRLHANVLHELRALISHPMCRCVWFGSPCGTFSSAPRNGGGPPPLRGTNHTDI